MSTLADLRAELRILLNDNAAEGYLWNDSTLNLHLNDAIRSYSRSFPRQLTATLVTVAGQRDYDLPPSCIDLLRVEIEDTGGLEPLKEGGDEDGVGYEVCGDKIVLFPTPDRSGQTIVVRYTAPHATLALDGDLSTVPAAEQDLLLTFAGARALQSLLSDEAKRRRFESQSGQPSGSVANLYWEQYERAVRLRTARVRPGKLAAV